VGVLDAAVTASNALALRRRLPPKHPAAVERKARRETVGRLGISSSYYLR